MSVFSKIVILILSALGGSLVAGSIQPDSLTYVPEPIPDNWLAKDKALHFSAAMIIAAGSTLIIEREAAISHKSARSFGLGFTMALGTMKEFRDSRNPRNHFCFKDLTADLAGALLGLLFMGLP